MVKSDKEAYKDDQDRYLPIVIQRCSNLSQILFQFGKTNDRKRKITVPKLKSPLFDRGLFNIIS
ncbi:hypothetical protein DXN04_07630 [Chitinophaga silvisoli]|uniref:Uncharacterized protein n=1 Tax=Chitinophaga silvisoli TaxID=2291814 RepID=A0A3E1P4Y0_9BACT|nr:hypothetical protein DXN04_07630 [Chitinophaga silvisoli]